MLLGHNKDNRAVFARPDHFDRHGYIIGTTGTGKTTTLLNLAQGIVSEKWGALIFIDPHGDASYQLAEMIDPTDVILFDPVNQTDCPMGMNLFSFPDPSRIDVSAEWAVTAIRKTISQDAQWGMTVDRVSRHLFYALAPQGGTLLEVPRFLTDQAFRARYYPYLEDHHPATHTFWYDEYDSLGLKRDTRVTKEQLEVAGPVLRRLDRYLSDSRLASILGQTRFALNLTDIMENGKTLIVRLPESELGEQAAGLLGSIVLAHLFVATLARSAKPRTERKPVYALIDEFQSFVSHEDLPRFLTESRKYAVHLIVAHQHRSQLDSPKIRDSVLGVGSILAFETLEKDSREIAAQMGVTEKLAELHKYEAWGKLDGEKPQFLKSLPELKGKEENRLEIERQSRKLGTPKEEVEREIAERNRKRYKVVEKAEEVKYDLQESSI